ncbi:MAG: hypothetical protein R3E39_12810 [Anaerolineae bacterium]
MDIKRIAILTDTELLGDRYQTDFGLSAPISIIEYDNYKLLVCSQEHSDPRATVRALKDMGATHLWLCESVGALSILLEPGDWLVADDYIDGTRGQHYTYFSEKAGGYVQQMPAFDNASRDALITGLTMQAAANKPAAAAQNRRIFRRGVYVCVGNTRLETPAEAAFWTRAGGHVVGRFLSPCLTLARELEMSVAVLVHVVRQGGNSGVSLPFSYYLDVLEPAVVSLISPE